jgi:hypothetical protein
MIDRTLRASRFEGFTHTQTYHPTIPPFVEAFGFTEKRRDIGAVMRFSDPPPQTGLAGSLPKSQYRGGTMIDLNEFPVVTEVSESYLN